jgi:uncharacterized protein (DUF1778 family)
MAAALERDCPHQGGGGPRQQYNVLTAREEAVGRNQVLQLRATAEQRQLIDQAAAAEGVSRTEFILRSCQERAQAVLLDQTLFSLSAEQSQALLADLCDAEQGKADQAVITELLAAAAPWDAPP